MATLTVGSGKDYSTIALAVAAANDNDTIQIYAGTYNETNIGLYDDGITFEAPDGEDVLCSGSNWASDYLIHSYGEFTSYNNLKFTGYRYAPQRRGGGGSHKFSMSGTIIYNCGGVSDSTIEIGGPWYLAPAAYTASIDSCIIHSKAGRLIQAHKDQLEITNCLLISDSYNSQVINASSWVNVTASFCTIIGSGQNGTIVDIPKLVNCIVSGTNSDPSYTPGAAGYVGAKGAAVRESNNNIIIADEGYIYQSVHPNAYLRSGSATNKTMVPPYFANPGTLGSANIFTDSYTLVETKSVDGVVPRAYYKMENGSGTTLTDSSTVGNSRDGICSSSHWDSTNKQVGSYSLSLGGNAARINGVCADIAGSDFSIFWWMKTTATSKNPLSIQYYDSDASRWTARLELSHDYNGKWYLSDCDTNYADLNVVGFNDGEWRHVGFTFDTSNKLMTFYQDGMLDGYHITDSCVTISSSDVIWLGNHGRGDGGWTGNIDELSVWNKILEPEHIQALYDAGIANTSKNSGFSTANYTNPAINAGVGFTGSFGPRTTDLSGNTRIDTPDAGAYEFFSTVTGYGNTIITVVAGSLGKILDITKANVSKVIGTQS